MATVDFEITLRLRWGHDAAREVTVPLEYRTGGYSGRYELYVDNAHVGWVVKIHGKWEGYVCAEQNGGYQQLAGIDETRRGAMLDVAWQLGRSSRTNVLAARAEAAYED